MLSICRLPWMNCFYNYHSLFRLSKFQMANQVPSNHEFGLKIILWDYKTCLPDHVENTIHNGTGPFQSSVSKIIYFFCQFTGSVTIEAASFTNMKPSKGCYVSLCDTLPLWLWTNRDLISWTDKQQAFLTILPGSTNDSLSFIFADRLVYIKVCDLLNKAKNVQSVPLPKACIY